jgi:hypothetical protein
LQASLRRNQVLVKTLGPTSGFAFYFSPFEGMMTKDLEEVPDEANGKTGPQTDNNSIWCDEMLADVVASYRRTWSDNIML